MGIFSQIKKRLGGTNEAEASKDSKVAKTASVNETKEVKAPKKAEKAEAKKEAKDTTTVIVSGNRAIIKHPDVTEKSTMLQAQGKYVFIVTDRATKTEVAKAMRSMYKVDVEHVRMLNRKGKPMSSGRNAGHRSDVKKAIVTLKKGQTISIFDGEAK
jgi:large subunit ribosomal protein L23